MKSSKTKPLSLLLRSPLELMEVRFRRALMQEQNLYEEKVANGILLLWLCFYSSQVFLSDLQKADVRPWITFRLVSISLLAVTFIISKQTSKHRLRIGFIICTAFFLPLSYAWMTRYGLPMRTSWIFILTATLLAPVARSFITGTLSISACSAIALTVIWKGQINTIWTVNDYLFGCLIAGLSTVLRYLWLKSEEQALISKEAVENDIRHQQAIYQKLAHFIPRSIHKRVEKRVQANEPIDSALSEYLDIRDRFVAILYSDFRDYSRRSDNLDFIRNELSECHSKTISTVEENEGVPQQAGDSVLAYFSYECPELCIVRALVAATECTQYELSRTKASGIQSFERYFIVTSGKANVGNVFGSETFEISVNGKPANLAARLDEITKNEFLKKRINQSGAFVVDFSTKKRVQEILPSLKIQEIDLRTMGIELRTYSEEKRIYLIEASTFNLTLFCELRDQLANVQVETSNAKAAA